MTWARLDDGFHSDPKILAAGNDGAGLFARSLSYASEHLTDGFLPHSWCVAAAPKRLRNRLVDLGLWAENGKGYTIPKFLVYNPSKADVQAERQRKSEGGKLGAQRRWSHGTSHNSSQGEPIVDPTGSRDAPDPYPTLRTPQRSLSNPPNPPSTKLACATCGATFKTHDKLTDHLANVHGLGEPEPAPPPDDLHAEAPATTHDDIPF